jgi:ribosome biogenesis protein Tsr3
MFYEVIVDMGETQNKCTISPLAYRTDFRLTHVKSDAKEDGLFGPLQSPLILHHEGECITTLVKSMGTVPGIACIDCVWRRLDGLLHRVAAPMPVYARIPDGFVTAYPRTSKQNTDPDTGLATIEAIFIAAALVGNWDASLLSEYYFGPKFIELNRTRFVELGVHQAADPAAMPVLNSKIRNSSQRRRDRGRY